MFEGQILQVFRVLSSVAEVWSATTRLLYVRIGRFSSCRWILLSVVTTIMGSVTPTPTPRGTWFGRVAFHSFSWPFLRYASDTARILLRTVLYKVKYLSPTIIRASAMNVEDDALWNCFLRKKLDSIVFSQFQVLPYG